MANTNPATKGQKGVTVTTTITPTPASEPGALDGFAIRCSECGPIGGASLETIAHTWAQDHRDWHSR